MCHSFYLLSVCMSSGALNVVINWKEPYTPAGAAADSDTVWTQTKDMGDQWNEARIRIDSPYRNFEVR